MKIKSFQFKGIVLLWNYFLIIFFLSDRPTQPFEWREMGNETFYWDGLSILLELQNRLFWMLKELHKISFVWKYEADMLNSFLWCVLKTWKFYKLRMYGLLTILPPSCFEFLLTSIHVSSLKLHVQNRKFSSVFFSISFLKFYIQFYFILFLSLPESVCYWNKT